MPLTQLQKEFLRNEHGLYMGTVQELKKAGIWQRAPKTHELKLQRTERTTRICRTCRGNRVIDVEHVGRGGIVTRMPCPQCTKSKVGKGLVFG